MGVGARQEGSDMGQGGGSDGARGWGPDRETIEVVTRWVQGWQGQTGDQGDGPRVTGARGGARRQGPDEG